MSRSVQLVLICEDSQHEAFVRRFLEKAGWMTRRLRVERAPPGKGSAEQFVRERFPAELKAYRIHRNRVAQGVIVMIDGDVQGIASRHMQLDKACENHGLPPRSHDEHVGVFVPTWNIETWFAYLSGQDIDEGKSDYPRLDRPRDCQQHVDQLYAMCQQKALRQPAPDSLVAACKEFETRMPS
jgi:hypothetical protein